MLKNPETAFLGLRGLLNQALARGDRGEALRLAGEAHSQRPEAGWAAKALLDLELEEGRWADARRSARAAARLKSITPDEARRIEAVTLLAEAEAEREPARAFSIARDAAKLLPDFVPTVAIEANAAFRAGRLRDAEKLIEKAWARGLAHPNLAAIYAALKPDEAPVDRARRFEKLAALKPDAEESRLALAETALAAGLWGQARQALDALLGAGAKSSARLARLMARLEEGERGDLVAARRWLLQAAEAAGDPAWVCGRCNAAAAEWHARCASCGAFDRQSWREAARVAPPALAAPAELPRALAAPAAAATAHAPAPERAAAEPPAPSVDAARLIT
jgi:HemY protein